MTKSNSIYFSGGKIAERKLTEECVTWCLKKLLPRFRTINLKVRIKEMEDWGCCYKLDEKGRQFF